MSEHQSAQPSGRADDVPAGLKRMLDEQERARTAKEEKATLREGVYMLIFQTVLLGMLFGVLGAMKSGFSRPTDASVFSFDYVAGDLSAVWTGMLAEVPAQWPIAAGLWLPVLAIAFAVKQPRRRRRFFTLAVAATAIVLTLLMSGHVFSLSQAAGHTW